MLTFLIALWLALRLLVVTIPLLLYSLGVRARWILGRGLAVRGRTVPENGLATTTVFGDVTGGGVGESVRKSGWICASFPLATDGVFGREVLEVTRRECTLYEVGGRERSRSR